VKAILSVMVIPKYLNFITLSKHFLGVVQYYDFAPYYADKT
jgi:hypothetical protein